jgi:ABC-type multidrug transport system ATPase subunit
MTVAIAPAQGAALELREVDVVRGRRTILEGVSLSVRPGELVAVVGGSGAGKSTLLETMAGLRAPRAGAVLVDGAATSRRDGTIGFVPQEPVLHGRLPLATSLRHAARLRTGGHREAVERDVADVMHALGLGSAARVAVAELSGGQRKRADIAAELLAGPAALLLDEPTSGLDAATATTLMGTLRELADAGTTVLMTTHRAADLEHCDRVVTVADGRATADTAHDPGVVRPSPGVPAVRRRAGAVVQWTELVRRGARLLVRDRLMLGIMVAAPTLVIGMFVMLFRRGALEGSSVEPTTAIGTAYWMAFAAFFFGLTFGLLQICTEHAIVRREVHAGVRIGAYLAAKTALLLPVLVAVDVAMVATLRWLDRLPAMGLSATAGLLVALTLTSLAALTLGLLASAAVGEPSHATLALPMLCFPAVLFAGAVLPVAAMGPGGRAVSIGVQARWAFEAVARELDVAALLRHDRAGTSALAAHDGALTGGVLGHWIVLIASTAATLAAAHAVVRRRALHR